MTDVVVVMISASALLRLRAKDQAATKCKDTTIVSHDSAASMVPALFIAASSVGFTLGLSKRREVGETLTSTVRLGLNSTREEDKRGREDTW